MPRGKRRPVNEIPDLIEKWRSKRDALEREIIEHYDAAAQLKGQVAILDKCIGDLESGFGDSLVLKTLPETALQIAGTTFIPKAKGNDFNDILFKILQEKGEVKISSIPALMKEQGYSFLARNAYVSAYGKIERQPDFFEKFEKEGNFYVKLKRPNIKNMENEKKE